MTPYDRFKTALMAFALVFLWAAQPAGPAAGRDLSGNSHGGNPEKGGPLRESGFEERLLELINDYRRQSSEGLLTPDPTSDHLPTT
jgi:hypothetical protein